MVFSLYLPLRSDIFIQRRNHNRTYLWYDQFLCLYMYMCVCVCVHVCVYIYMLCYAKSLQSCPTLCNPIDGSPPGSAIPGILQARILEWVAISFSNAWKRKVKVKSLSHVWLLATPWTAAYQAPLSMDFPGKSTGVGCHYLLQCVCVYIYIYICVCVCMCIYIFIYIYKVYKTLEFTLITLFSWSLPLTLTSWHMSEEKIDCYRGYECVCAQLYPILCELMDCSPPGSSVHGTSQARILQWVAIPFSKDLPDPAIEPASPALQVDSLLLSHQGIPIRGYSKRIFLNLFTWYDNCFV